MASLLPTYFFIIALLFTSGLCEMGEEVEASMKATKRCTEGLGVCSIENCDEACCEKLCYNDYAGANPTAICDKYPGFSARLCLCQHDC